MVCLPLLPGGLSLGMLIAMAIGRGIVSFAIIALLMAWIIKIGHTRTPSRVRTATELAMSGQPQGFSSRFSLTPPGINPLPQPPRHDSFNFSRTTGKQPADKMSRISGDNFPGKTGQTNSKEAWLRESLTRQVPTKSNLSADERGRDEIYDIRRQKAQHKISYQEIRAQRPLRRHLMKSRLNFNNISRIPTNHKCSIPTKKRIVLDAKWQTAEVMEVG